MHSTRATIVLSFLILFSQCGKTQNTDRARARSAAVKDSIAHANMQAAHKQRYLATLDQVKNTMAATKDMPDAERLIHAEYATFKALAILIRTLDTSAIVQKEVGEEEQRLIREDSTRAGQAGKITNGILGIYSLYGMLYHMRFGQNQSKLDAYNAIHKDVVEKLRPGILAIEAVAAMSKGIYEMAKTIVDDLDRQDIYANQFEIVEQQYEDGVKSAETDEDRFLNGVYRTFEIAQLWALYLDPSSKEEISQLYREMYSATKRSEGIGPQLAVATEFLYKIHDMVARRSIRLTF
jgi:hypothetical protein